MAGKRQTQGPHNPIGVIRIPVPALQSSAQQMPVHRDWFAVQSPQGLPIRHKEFGVLSLQLLLLLRQHPSARSRATDAKVASRHAWEATHSVGGEPLLRGKLPFGGVSGAVDDGGGSGINGGGGPPPGVPHLAIPKREERDVVSTAGEGDVVSAAAAGEVPDDEENGQESDEVLTPMSSKPMTPDLPLSPISSAVELVDAEKGGGGGDHGRPRGYRTRPIHGVEQCVPKPL